MDLTERGASAHRHPWEVQRFEAYRRILAEHGTLTAGRILDVGAGDGWFADSLAQYLAPDAEIVCWDVNYADDELESDDSRVRRVREAPAGPFDLVLALDVLEHIEDPNAFVADELSACTRPGTQALVAVPAYQWLFSAHDLALGHHRRYSRHRLLDELESWLDVSDHGSLFTSLVPARALAVLRERVRGHRSDEVGIGGWEGGPVATRTASAVLGVDARVGRALARRGLRLPGLSHWAFGSVR